MKKLILSLIIGAMLIGAGIGVLFVEMAEFTSTDYLPYVQQTKTEKFNYFSESHFSIFSADLRFATHAVWFSSSAV